MRPRYKDAKNGTKVHGYKKRDQKMYHLINDAFSVGTKKVYSYTVTRPQK